MGMYDVSPMRIFRQPKDAKKRKGGLFQRHMSGGGAGGDSNAAAAADANISSSPQHSKMGVVITSSRQAHRRYGELCWFFFSFVYCLLCRVQIYGGEEKSPQTTVQRCITRPLNTEGLISFEIELAFLLEYSILVSSSSQFP